MSKESQKTNRVSRVTGGRGAGLGGHFLPFAKRPLVTNGHGEFNECWIWGHTRRVALSSCRLIGDW